MNLQKSTKPQNPYQWEKTYTNLPGHIKGVPKGQGFSLQKLLLFLFTTIKGIVGLLTAQFWHLFPYLWDKITHGELIFTGTADLGLKAIFAEFNNWNNFQEFHEFFQPWTFFQEPDISYEWQDDIEFGRQRLNGLNPISIRKCKPEDIDIQGKFPVTDEIVNPVQKKTINLQTALENQCLYILEYPLLDDILNSEVEDQLGRYIQSPICLLYLDGQKDLIPIAIQVQYESEDRKSKTNRIITPKTRQEWLAAKIAVSNADATYQGIISHLLYTHLIIEPFAVSTYRKLSPDHIIYQLLTPHYFNTFAINNMARSTFLGRGGFFDVTGSLGYTGSNKLLDRGYNGYLDKIQPLQFYQLALPYSLESRGVLDLPNYYYRDDALLLWNALKKYITEVINIKYKTDDDVINDKQIQNWKQEIITVGNIKGLLPPEKNNELNTIQDLIEVVTNIIFTATAQHAAVNFAQYDYAGWIPNNPFALYQPFQDSPTTIDPIQLLPNRFQSIQQIVLVKVLTMSVPHSSESLVTLENPFSDGLARTAFQKLQTQLVDIEDQINIRNSSIKKPYTYLLPSRIPQSIAI